MRLHRTFLAAGFLIAGCSSNNAPPPAGTSGTGDGSATMTVGSPGADAGSCGDAPAVWKEDGALHCGPSGEAILSTNTSENPYDGGQVLDPALEVAILAPDTPYIFSILVTTSDVLGGTYTCVAGTTSVVE